MRLQKNIVKIDIKQCETSNAVKQSENEKVPEKLTDFIVNIWAAF